MSQHVVPIRVYVKAFAALLVLLALTVAAGRIEHGPLALAIGLSIGVTKACVIALVFMHIRWSPPTARLAAASGLVWLAILLTLTMSDLLTRQWPPAP